MLVIDGFTGSDWVAYTRKLAAKSKKNKLLAVVVVY